MLVDSTPETRAKPLPPRRTLSNYDQKNVLHVMTLQYYQAGVINLHSSVPTSPT